MTEITKAARETQLQNESQPSYVVITFPLSVKRVHLPCDESFRAELPALKEEKKYLYKALRNFWEQLLFGGMQYVLLFVVSILLARVLGKAGLGLYSYVGSLAMPLWVGIEFGIDNYLVRELAIHPERSHELCVQTSSLRLAFAVIVFLAIAPVLASLQPEPDAAIGLLLYCAGFVARSLYLPYISILRARQKYYQAQRFDIGAAAFQLIGAVAILVTSRSLIAIFVVTAAADILKMFPALRLYKHEMGTSLIRSLRFKWVEQKIILRITLPFALVNILGILQSRADILLLEHFRSVSDVGVYSAGERFINALTIIPMAVYNGLLPLFSLSRGKTFSEKFSFQSIAVFSLIGLAISLFFYFAAPLAIGLTFRFPESVIVLRIITWSFAFFLFNTIVESWLYGQRRERYVVIVRVIGVITIVATNFYFTPLYGATGTAISTTLSEGILAIAFAAGFMRARRKNARHAANIPAEGS